MIMIMMIMIIIIIFTIIVMIISTIYSAPGPDTVCASESGEEGVVRIY